MRPDGIQEPPRATLTETPPSDEPVTVSTTVHEILVGNTRLRVERDCATGKQAYFVNGQLRAKPGAIRAPADFKLDHYRQLDPAHCGAVGGWSPKTASR
jgi:hypothetical protein